MAAGPDIATRPASTRQHRTISTGGDLTGIRSKVDYIAGFGTTIVLLSQVFATAAPDAGVPNYLGLGLAGDPARQDRVMAPRRI